jgi:hypothetical protein
MYHPLYTVADSRNLIFAVIRSIVHGYQIAKREGRHYLEQLTTKKSEDEREALHTCTHTHKGSKIYTRRKKERSIIIYHEWLGAMHQFDLCRVARLLRLLGIHDQRQGLVSTKSGGG